MPELTAKGETPSRNSPGTERSSPVMMEISAAFRSAPNAAKARI